jgi:hypothetical protein
LARAKNTIRSEARRRTREQNRSELVGEDASLDGDDVAVPTSTTVAPRSRTQLFKFPNVRDDIRSVPGMFRTRKLLFLPFALLLVGFILVLSVNLIPVSVQTWVGLYIQYFFLPEALFTYFIGGFLAPRASYLIGLMLGLMCGLLWTAILLIQPGTQDAVAAQTDLGSAIGLVLVQSVVLGLFAGGFAGWYRDFLRGMQNRSRERQAERETALKAQRRDERQEQRRNAKQKPVG